MSSFRNIFSKSSSSSPRNTSLPITRQQLPTTRGSIIKAQHPTLSPQEQELVDFSEKIVDLVFVCDNTGSMSGEINVAKDTIQTIITSLHDHFKSDLRFSAVSYRDHSDDYAVKEFPFTRDVQVAKLYVHEMFASGGGDYPEALASALKVVSEMPFNKKGKKIVVWIADAPPHGMGASGDSYPEGCKDENNQVIDWIKLGDYLMEKGCVFYTLVCERSQHDKQLTLFLDFLATKTNGKCLLLTNANKVPNLIINGCIEDDEMDKLIAEKIKELGEDRVKEMKQEELIEQINKLTENAKVQQVQTYELQSDQTKLLMQCDSLSKVSTDVYRKASNCVNMAGNSDVSSFSYGSVAYCKPSISQVAKACQRNVISKKQ
ncbi:hypothetical protein FDP41_005177 [Naegleria fowleri]|uniref:VWFA domain-containing protein n=1 Tax=Naegleria fowleri TaxID=5763 RepID=A0A6A5BPJ7_NAEFO|nr:uncharacterized protein FDP41_005177 [Naegleria fowleri]KAF0975850.1 hypothetical protein FDP41_005177 [Naegleria fowleri]CAG4714188.1 unnamed protein product [Naegleria fowleri]